MALELLYSRPHPSSSSSLASRPHRKTNMWWFRLAASTTTTTVTSSLLLRRLLNKSVSSKSCRAALIHQTSFFNTTTTTFNSSPSSSSSNFGGDGTFILHDEQQANNNLHTTTTSSPSSSSSSKFGDTTFILQTYELSSVKYDADIKLYMLSSESGSGSDGEDDDDQKKKKKKKKMVFKLDEDLGFSAMYKDYLLEDSLLMIGSCNGIICLHDPKAMGDNRAGYRQHYSNLRDVCLWNPATRHFRILPKSIHIEKGKHWVGSSSQKVYFEDFVAFGFDVENNDYKVFRINSFIQQESGRGVEGCMCDVQVYSLSTDSWRLLEGINSLPAIPSQYSRSNNHGIYLNGSYFFLGRKNKYAKSDLMILSFDFTKEIFTSMQLPDNSSSSRTHNTVLSCMGDKLAVFTGPRIDDRYEYYDIWVLNEQQQQQHCTSSGGGESWTKLHSFPLMETKRGHYYYSQLPKSQPRCISNNGEFALISSGYNDGRTNKLQLFNLVTKEVEKDLFLINNNIHMCRADVYKESQVSIMGGGNVLLRWQLPTHGTTYKLNLNTSLDDFDFVLGIGLCLISDTGGCIGVRSVKRYVSDAEEGEAHAMLEAIKWAIKLELSPIIIESDSKNVVSFFMEDDDDNNSTYWSSEALSLLREAKLLLNSSEIGIISFQYCSRSCNYVADIASKLSKEGFWFCKEWTADSPGDIVSSLSKDLGLISEKYFTDET